MRAAPEIVLTGSSAAGALDLELVAPDTVDAYVRAREADRLIAEHGLEDVESAQPNVTLGVIPDEAWMLDRRRIAPLAAVGLDLASYSDSRSSRVGREILQRLDRDRHERGASA